MTDEEMKREKAICEAAGVAEIDDVSDGYHTFRQLYYQRMMLFATIVKQNKDKAWKSLRHEDGELCFGGGWFIVGVDTPKGCYTYHYENCYFSLFDCEELECSKHWDGHTEKDVTRLLSLSDPEVQVSLTELQERRRATTLDEAIKHATEVAEVQEKKCKQAGYNHYAKLEASACAADHRQLAKWLTELKERREKDEQSSCSEKPNRSDLISRQAAIDAVNQYNFDFPQYMERFVTELRDAMKADLKRDIEALPSAEPEQIRTQMSSADCISRKAVIDEIKFELEMINSALDSTTLDFNARERLRQRRGEAREILNSIQQLPPAEPERKKDEWIQDDITSNIFRCSECGCDAPVDPTAGCEIKSNFCQSCGADMRGKQSTGVQDILQYLDEHLHPIVSPEHWNVYSELHDMISRLSSAQPEQQWIPCSERPPEEEGEYLITVKYKPVDGYEDVYTEDGEWVNGRWVPSVRRCGEVESILAWMPMPEPYKEGRVLTELKERKEKDE